MHSHLFGQILDVVPDGIANRRTTATCFGPRAAKVMLTAMLAFESVFIWHAFHIHWLSWALSAGAFWFLVDAGWIFRERPYPPVIMRLVILAVNVGSIGSIPWAWTSGVFR